MNSPEQRIFVMEGCLSVFGLGLICLIPPIGVIVAPLVLWRFFTLWSIAGSSWNPARSYLYYGLVSGFLGGLISLLLVLLVIASLIG